MSSLLCSKCLLNRRMILHWYECLVLFLIVCRSKKSCSFLLHMASLCLKSVGTVEQHTSIPFSTSILLTYSLRLSFSPSVQMDTQFEIESREKKKK